MRNIKKKSIEVSEEYPWIYIELHCVKFLKTILLRVALVKTSNPTQVLPTRPEAFPSVWDQLRRGEPPIGCVKSPPFPSLSCVVCSPSIHLLSILRTSRISLSQMSAGYVCNRFIVSWSQGIGKHPQLKRSLRLAAQMGPLSSFTCSSCSLHLLPAFTPPWGLSLS